MNTRPAFDRIHPLIQTSTLAALDCYRRPNTKKASVLAQELKPLVQECNVRSPSDKLVLGAALFWHDHLDAAHQIAQEIAIPDGSWLHGMIHRREPDFSNARYWFHRVGKHPAFPELGRAAAAFLPGHLNLRNDLLPNGIWDPIAFISACEEAAGSPDNEETQTLKEIQRIEFEVFLRHVTLV